MEKRKSPRVDVSRPVLYFTDIYGRPKVASTRNLSLGGTRIETSYGLIAGERLEVTIPIQPQAITCRGKTVYVLCPESGKMEAGIQFEELSEYDKLYLKEYLTPLLDPHASS